jgi:hypothetical protein
MRFVTPGPLSAEVQELHVSLSEAARLEGPVGEAAMAAARLLQPHLVKEVEVALPPLGLIESVAAGNITREMADVLPLTEAVRRELPRMLAEHERIIGAVSIFAELAGRAGRLDCVRFAERFIRHLRTEEVVLYPAVVLLGEYLKLKLDRGATEPQAAPGG